MKSLIQLFLMSCVGWFAAVNSARAGNPLIEVVGGFDGANPQSQEAILRETPNRFRIKPFNEEGSNDAYYFRFNTKIINHSKKTQSLELVIEWPVLKEHPDYSYDTYYYGDMGNWQWTYAHVDGITAKMHITVPPGITYVGRYPRYNYEYFNEYMTKLKTNRHLTKSVEGKSFHGRNLWHAKITDPDVPDQNKRTILITARNHPYETSGSYIAEAIINYLQGNTAEVKKIKRENIIYLIPMLNPDGVVMGLNQQTRPNGVNISYGVGSDDPAVTTLLSTVDKIKPDLWADVHSWPHHADDGMWCTHKWIADGLLSKLPDKTFNDYIWKVSFVSERGVPDNHLWQWLIKTHNSGGVSLSMSWYRRSEADIRNIGVRLIQAMSATVRDAK